MYLSLPLLLNLLVSAGFELENAYDAHEYEEHDGLGLAGTLGVGGIGVDDVERQHFRRLDDTAVGQRLERRTARQGQVLVIELEAVGE